MTPGRTLTLSETLSLKWQIVVMGQVLCKLIFILMVVSCNKGLTTAVEQTRKLRVSKAKRGTEGHKLTNAELPD